MLSRDQKLPPRKSGFQASRAAREVPGIAGEQEVLQRWRRFTCLGKVKKGVRPWRGLCGTVDEHRGLRSIAGGACGLITQGDFPPAFVEEAGMTKGCPCPSQDARTGVAMEIPEGEGRLGLHLSMNPKGD